MVTNVSDIDLVVARAWAYRPSGWIGSSTGWAEDVLHDGGRNAVRGVFAACLVAALLVRHTAWREAATYLCIALAASALLAGTLKHLTNVDCPWDLDGFGGTRPYVHLFGDRPDALPRAACFPGAHSASGFSLAAFYFVLRDRHRGPARFALAAALATGAAFSVAQEARGAHFLSHDVASAFLAWFVCLALYWRRKPGRSGV
jgi:membrane-associated PAP2 superfamily phosphatase